MKEGDKRLRSGASPQAAAAIRNTVIAAPRLAGFTSTAAGRRWASRSPARALVVLSQMVRNVVRQRIRENSLLAT
jgi:hypothetical protein